MTDAEIKLLNAKYSLLSEIESAKDQIKYHITSGAKKYRELLQNAKKDEGAILNKDDYDKILNYLLNVERDAIYNLEGSKYLENYYLTIEIKTEILKKL